MPAKPELFVSDPHGEYEPFAYIVRSGCGRVRRAIDALFGDAMIFLSTVCAASGRIGKTAACHCEQNLVQIKEI